MSPSSGERSSLADRGFHRLLVPLELVPRVSDNALHGRRRRPNWERFAKQLFDLARRHERGQKRDHLAHVRGHELACHATGCIQRYEARTAAIPRVPTAFDRRLAETCSGMGDDAQQRSVDLDELRNLVEQQSKTIEEQQSLIAKVLQQIEVLKNGQFGASSAKRPVDWTDVIEGMTGLLPFP